MFWQASQSGSREQVYIFEYISVCVVLQIGCVVVQKCLIQPFDGLSTCQHLHLSKVYAEWLYQNVATALN